MGFEGPKIALSVTVAEGLKKMKAVRGYLELQSVGPLHFRPERREDCLESLKCPPNCSITLWGVKWPNFLAVNGQATSW